MDSVTLSMFALYVAAGFLAQCIDGALGMAYGVSCRTFLRSFTGLPTVIVSAVVHCAEMVVTLASGIGHVRMNNVIKELLWRLMLPGVVGGVLGAWFVSAAGEVLEPFVDGYLLVMGLVICRRAFQTEEKPPKSLGWRIVPLGFAGGFLDAAGGGWGPVVTTTLLASGHDAKKSIGTVNAAEFAVTAAETAAFAGLVGNLGSYWLVILGVALGGVLAVPAAVYFCKKLPVRPLLLLVGGLVILLNLYNLAVVIAG